jgi:predicted nucleic acid-binding protein
VTAATEYVFDASAVLRGLTTGGEAAALLDQVEQGDVVGHAPDVIVAEIANAVVLTVRVGGRSLSDALFDLFVESPLELHPTRPMAQTTIGVATALSLSAYDAFYAVLSATLDAPLVTADRKLAGAVPGAVLVS